MLAEIKDIDVAVRGYIRPILKKAGFTRFQNRTAWRHREHSIDVVAVTCVGVIRCTDPDMTPCSFMVEAGGYLPYVPYQFGDSPPRRNNKLFPREADCPFRFCPRRQMFEIRRDGSNIQSSVAAAAELIVIDALPWMNGYATPQGAFDMLMKHSPQHPYFLGFTAKHIGELEIARQQLRTAIESKCFINKLPELVQALEELDSLSA